MNRMYIFHNAQRTITPKKLALVAQMIATVNHVTVIIKSVEANLHNVKDVVILAVVQLIAMVVMVMEDFVKNLLEKASKRKYGTRCVSRQHFT